MIGTSREEVTKKLQPLKDQGVISTQPRRPGIVIRDHTKLRALAHQKPGGPGDIRVAGCGASESAPGGSALGARLSASGWRRPDAFEGFHYFGRVSPLSGPRPALSQGKAVLYEATTRYLRPGPSER